MTHATVAVDLPGRPYLVHIGPGLLADLAALAALPASARRAALVSPEPVLRRYGAAVAGALRSAGLAVDTVAVADGELAKTLDTLAAVYQRFAALPLRRGDLVVALGGGVVGDLAGFAAATWHRGVALLQVPTTLLAQVDSAIGGKTGVNLAEGKNLVGAFHQPVAVLADTATLATLTPRERRAGLGEVAKYGFIADPVVLELLEKSPDEAVAGGPVVAELVRRGVTVKARVVAADEQELGQRALLNYGHTIGHAVEALTGYQTYRHGEAVALGMVAAARLGEALGVSEAGLADRTVSLLRRLGLPTGGVELDPSAVAVMLGRDKKATTAVRFVLCRRPGDAVVVDVPDPGLIEQVVRSLR